ncbi:MAG: flavin reductase family protein [Treponema sp.]|jgi:flavin reductase (DIM6/NTAB) family NADH-FMN oxidoreductase RutF|nr:flavin reductase family protein [Treponema sp.]
MKQTNAVPAGKGWVSKSTRDFRGSPVARIGSEWMLITAGDDPLSGEWNTMTASWGGLGVLWGRDVAFMVIRQSRHTLEFAERAGLFTLSFFGGGCRKALDFCGAKSGRDYDKAAETGLTPIVFGKEDADGKAAGAVGFAEASEIIVCRKLYTHDFAPGGFLDPSIDSGCYPQKDYHRLFIGETLVMMEKAGS